MSWALVFEVCGLNLASAMLLTVASLAAAWAVLRRPGVQQQVMNAIMRRLMGGG